MYTHLTFVLFFTLLNVISPTITFPAETTGSSSSNNGRQANKFPVVWVADLFYQTLANFTVSLNVGNSVCTKQTKMYTRHLENDSIWAVQMSDSWSRYPNGILVGTTHQMGVYEECINVHQPIQGKFCIPHVKLVSASGIDFTVGKPKEPNINDHAWNEILGYIDYNNQFDRNMVKFGICIPDACTASDLEISLQTEFDKHFLPHQVKAHVKVDSILCSTSKDVYPYDDGFYVTSSLLGLIFFICCLSTLYHFTTTVIRGEKENKIPEMIKLFSMISNGRNLIKYDRNNDLNIFNGLKVWTMILVLFGHKFIYLVINPISYGKRLETVYTKGPDFLLTSINLVDPFFYMTGYLMYVMLIPQFSKPGTNWLQIPMVFIYKYMMILPSYVVMILLTAFVIPHVSNGPFWASIIWPEADKCKKYWWANMLAISNLVDAENQCLMVSWYISCLLQFLVIGCVIVYTYVKNRRIGKYLIVLLLLSSLVIPYIMTYKYRGWSIVRLLRSTLDNPRSSFEFNHLYRAFYLRGTPYFAGLLAGIVVEEMKKRKIKFSKLVLYVGTVVITVISMWIQLYGAKFYDVFRPYNILEQSLYSTLSHCTWTVILFWVTICHFTTGYGPLEKLFNNRLVVPLGRLSYAVYIVNISVMMIIESRQRVTFYPSRESIVDGWISGACRTYFAATMLYLIIEAPFGLLIKKTFYGKKHTTKDHISTTNTSKTETDLKDSTSSKL